MVVIVIHSSCSEIRFQAELQLALDISRAEQEPFIAQQEQGGSDANFASHYPSYHPFMNDHHELDTMATGNVDVNSSEQHARQSTADSYHGDNDSVNDDYIEVLGAHRRSPIFI